MELVDGQHLVMAECFACGRNACGGRFQDNTPTVSLSGGAFGLPIGTYMATVAFSNVTTSNTQNRLFTLQIVPSVPPTIVTPPSNQFAAVGTSVAFSVTAGGIPPLNYQWQVNTTNINGATNASLTLTNVGFGDAGSYTVTVTNTHGATQRYGRHVDRWQLPSITVQPQNIETIQGSNAAFSVTATGTAPLSYQWYSTWRCRGAGDQFDFGSVKRSTCQWRRVWCVG